MRKQLFIYSFIHFLFTWWAHLFVCLWQSQDRGIPIPGQDRGSTPHPADRGYPIPSQDRAYPTISRIGVPPPSRSQVRTGEGLSWFEIVLQCAKSYFPGRKTLEGKLWFFSSSSAAVLIHRLYSVIYVQLLDVYLTFILRWADTLI